MLHLSRTTGPGRNALPGKSASGTSASGMYVSQAIANVCWFLNVSLSCKRMVQLPTTSSLASSIIFAYGCSTSEQKPSDQSCRTCMLACVLRERVVGVVKRCIRPRVSSGIQLRG